MNPGSGIRSKLPDLDSEAVAHGERVAARVREAIQRAGGAIGFSEYMELALYAPGLGYYSAGTVRFGADGDFVTAPELSPLFAECVARQIAEVLTVLAGGDVCEVGAGSGVQAAGLLGGLEADGALPDRYVILERSAALRARQRETLWAKVPHLLERVSWLDDFPASAFRGVVIANELLDALPAHRFRIRGKGFRECCVEWRDDRFAWLERDGRDDALGECVSQILASVSSRLPNGYVSECAPARGAWIAELGACLETGVLLLFDYGYTRAEYYHPQRSSGTLRCHFRNRAHDDPLILTGLQDISVHVDFSAIAEAGARAGLTLEGFTTQAEFLLAAGLLESCAHLEPGSRDHVELTTQIKRLTLPGDMGEAVKVLALSRNYPGSLRGLLGRDLRGRL